ncbi:MAG TPA: putative quinol monooxygenase [Burkholderiaceae bacterium]|nr:putative quinol monooxygenase [Burkholderiaceae bacterium]
MLQALIVEFQIKTPFVDDFAAAIKTNADASLAEEPGCLLFDVCRDPADPTAFFLYELYEDESAIEAHLGSRHFRAFDELTATWVTGKTVRKMHRSEAGMSVAALRQRKPT